MNGRLGLPWRIEPAAVNSICGRAGQSFSGAEQSRMVFSSSVVVVARADSPVCYLTKITSIMTIFQLTIATIKLLIKRPGSGHSSGQMEIS